MPSRNRVPSAENRHSIGSIIGPVGGLLGIVGSIFAAYLFVSGQFVSRRDFEDLKTALGNQVEAVARAAKDLDNRLKKPEGLSQEVDNLKNSIDGALEQTARIRSVLGTTHIIFSMHDCTVGKDAELKCSTCCTQRGGQCLGSVNTKAPGALTTCDVDPSGDGYWCICSTTG